MTGIVCAIVGNAVVTAVAEVIRRKKSAYAVSVEVDTAQSKFGGASMAVGSGYLQIADDASFSFGTGDFTIELWYRPTGLDSTDILWDQRPSGSQGIQPTIYTQGQQLIYYTNAGNRITGGNLSFNTWQHIAVCRSGTSTRMFINGTQTGSTYTDTNNYVSSAAGIRIGSDQFQANTNYSVGHIDEIRVSNSARYTANFTAPTTPFTNDSNTLLLIHCDGTDATTYFEDDNGVRVKQGITAFGNAQIDTAQSKFGGASALFDGSGDYLLVSSNNNFAFGTGDFTIEGWIRFNNFTNGPVFVDMRIDGNSQIRPTIYFNTSGAPIYFTNGSNRITGNNLSTGVWYHLAVSRSGTSTRMFVDGTQVGSTYTDSNNYLDARIGIGIVPYDTAFGALNGWIDEFRISNTARYTAAFTPSTTPFVNDANTLLLIHCDGTDASTVFEDDNGQNPPRTPKHISYYGNAQIDTAQSKFGGASALFDGTGDYLLLQTDSDLQLTNSESWTIEMWIRPASVGNSVIIGAYSTGSPFNGYALYMSRLTSGVLEFYDGGNWRAFDGTFAINTWYHIAVSSSAGSVKMFKDGTQQTTTFTAPSGINNTTKNIEIGAINGGTGWNGHIDELRYSSTARYTASFTPPTAPFVNDDDTLLLLHFDGADAATTFIDDAGQRIKKAITAVGNAQIDTAQSKFGGSSALFDGTGDGLSVFNPGFNWGTGDFTVEAWVRHSAINDQQVYWDLRSTGTDHQIFYVKSDNKLEYYDGSNTYTSTETMAANTWYHLAISRSGSSLKIFRDGVALITQTNTRSQSSTGTAAIGNDYTYSAGNSMNGWIDELRISNTARYTANFTPSTTPFQNDANTLLLLHMDGTDALTVFRDDNGVTPTHQYS